MLLERDRAGAAPGKTEKVTGMQEDKIGAE
jgi:hypothetical protein